MSLSKSVIEIYTTLRHTKGDDMTEIRVQIRAKTFKATQLILRL
jgi:hypothetical protein